VPLTAISIKGYRSIPNLYLQVEPCSVFVGENGVGKSNLYKALGYCAPPRGDDHTRHRAGRRRRIRPMGRRRPHAREPCG
jgi:recombinational DNA repair ATPase RecF